MKSPHPQAFAAAAARAERLGLGAAVARAKHVRGALQREVVAAVAAAAAAGDAAQVTRWHTQVSPTCGL